MKTVEHASENVDVEHREHVHANPYEHARRAWNDLAAVIARATIDLNKWGDEVQAQLEAERKKKPPMWAQDPTKSKRPTKGRGHRRVK
jgi:hypothetical protein